MLASGQHFRLQLNGSCSHVPSCSLCVCVLATLPAADLRQRLPLGLPAGGGSGAAGCIVASSTAEDGSLFVAGPESGAVKQVGRQVMRRAGAWLQLSAVLQCCSAAVVACYRHTGHLATPAHTSSRLPACPPTSTPCAATAGGLCAAGPAGSGAGRARRGSRVGCPHARCTGAFCFVVVVWEPAEVLPGLLPLRTSQCGSGTCPAALQADERKQLEDGIHLSFGQRLFRWGAGLDFFAGAVWPGTALLRASALQV